ncbi:hypothetical protein FJTKL_10638 [Diaporthe vaccinii]|uniref:Secreted protein n=1 Tax=Diaporthe vaccinii TaxID=105482 RepID=A0ABR4EJE9_9PEZI
MTACAPKWVAKSLLFLATSETMIFWHPLLTSAWITASPMGPPPRTSAVSPSLKGEILTACQPTARGSTRAPTSRETLAGSGLTAAAGALVSSDMPPPQPLRPRNPLPSQQLTRPLLHELHESSQRVGWMQTLSPFLTWVTPSPTSSTTPENSWPRVRGSVSPVMGCGCPGVGIRFAPLTYSCRSVPQMPQNLGAILTQPGFTGPGSGTCSRRTSRCP